MIRTLGLEFAYSAAASMAFADLDIPQGATLVLKGPSGSGKSTWLALAAGLLTPTRGTMQVAGQDVGALPPAARDAWRAKTLGFLPQKLHLSEALTVRQNLLLVYFAVGLPQDLAAVQRVESVLGLAPFAHRKPHHLSGGQAQRVALARAVLLAPGVLLADEPTASLDDDAAADALGLLRGCAESAGATLVIATHDPRVQQAFPQAILCQIGQMPASNGVGAL